MGVLHVLIFSVSTVIFKNNGGRSIRATRLGLLLGIYNLFNYTAIPIVSVIVIAGAYKLTHNIREGFLLGLITGITALILVSIYNSLINIWIQEGTLRLESIIRLYPSIIIIVIFYITAGVIGGCVKEIKFFKKKGDILRDY